MKINRLIIIFGFLDVTILLRHKIIKKTPCKFRDHIVHHTYNIEK